MSKKNLILILVGVIALSGVFGAVWVKVSNLGSGGRTILNDPDAAALPIDLTSGITGVLPQANGGTNASTDFTAGSVLFDNGTALAQNNAEFFWDNTNFRLGVATVTPGAALSVAGDALLNGTTTVGNLHATSSIRVMEIYGDTPDVHIHLNTTDGTHLGYGSGVNHTNYVLTGNIHQWLTNGGTERMRLNATGLGIATDTPGVALSVAGSAIISATTTTNEVRIKDAAYSECKQVSTAEFDGTKGNCFEYATTTDGTIEVFGLKGNQPMTIWYYHNDRSAVAFASSSANGITFKFVDGKATTTTEGLTKALDQIVIRAVGTSTTEYSVNVIPNVADMR